MTVPIKDLARTLLDEPRWVLARWMLLSGRAEVTGLSGDRRRFVASSTVWPVIAVVGRPDAPFIEGAASALAAGGFVVAAEEHGDHVAAVLPGWRRLGASALAWIAGTPLPGPPPTSDARLLETGELAALIHVPTALREAVVTASGWAPVAGAFSGGAPVSFCFARAVTETLWDVGLATLEGYRRRGLAKKALRCLAAAMSDRHTWPVWIAEDEDAASRQFAASFGFAPSGRLALFRPRVGH